MPKLHNTAPPRRLLTAVLILSACAVLSACALFDSDGQAHSDQMIPLTINSGRYTNAGAGGKPLSVLVHFYVLKDPNRFEQLSMQDLLDPGAAKQALEADLVMARHTFIVPEDTYSTEFPSKRGRYLGVAALFLNPAPHRWRVVFDLSPRTDPIKMGLNACAITVSSGKLVDADADAFKRLSNVNCPQWADGQS